MIGPRFRLNAKYFSFPIAYLYSGGSSVFGQCMELVALILLFALFAGIAAIVQSPLIVGFGLGFWLVYKGMGD